MIFKLATIY